MSKSPTRVQFLWHMHQPNYRHPHKDYFLLPWVRLHGIKDYWGMAKIVEKFDTMKVTFNFSGILLRQLFDYANNNALDYYGILTLKKPSQLDQQERDFIVNRFFSINFDRHILPHQRYLQLYNKKVSPCPHFTNEDIGDLQAIFNLCWFHPYSFKKDRHLRNLYKKGKEYSQTDREYIIDKQYDILREIIPLYQKLNISGRIGLTVTPYHHPIMPLIYDTEVLKDMAHLKMPALRFSAPQDCCWHLAKAKEACQDIFGVIPVGSWPSEGSVSEAVLGIYKQEGFKWIGADETILFKSLVTDTINFDMIKNQRHIIYRPYNFRGVNIFFRDRNLSDTIGFAYANWEDSVFAANDFLEHCKRVHAYAKDIFNQRAITVIMDGENAWEYYPNSGIDFLETIYAALEKSNILTSSTPEEFLTATISRPLERVASGSWINGDFGVWIGSKTNNRYWEIMRQLRDLIEACPRQSNYEKIMEYFHLIEGSDWYWWNTFEDFSGEFKNIFYSYVEEIYNLMDKKMPANIRA